MKKNIIIGFLVLVLLGGVLFISTGEKNIFRREDSEMAEDYPQIYETDVESADDCASFEKYDPENKICSFECKDANECETLSKKADEEFANWTKELSQDKEPVQEKSIKETSGDLSASYKVTTGEKLTFESGNDQEKYRKIWDEIKELSPDSLSDNFIEEYQVFDNKSDDTLAFVDDEDGNRKWRVAVNLAGYNSSTERENKATFIHELGHIITLNTTQLDPNVDNCQNLKLDEGCAKNNSFINTFWNKFWKDVKNPGFDENKFVTEYATTNEVEDMAETFAFFVLENNPSTDSVRDQKIKLLYNFPDLVAIRTEMRNTLSKNIIRAKMKTS